MRSLAIALLLASTGAAQVIVDPARVGSMVKALERQADERPLRCEVTPIKPSLNFGFRFQAGYVVHVPMNQYSGAGHGWAMLTRVTPEGGGQQPVYLGSRVGLPTIPKTKVDIEVGGGYLLGEGRYDVDWALLDDTGRVCRSSWRVDARLGRHERQVNVAMPRDTVADFTLRGRSGRKRGADDAAPIRLTVLLDAAPLVPFRTRLRASDRVILLGLLSSLLERVPVRFVRLVIFNLDQQKTLLRQDAFAPNALGRVAQSLNGAELGRVDYHVLQNPHGHVDFLAGLINQELRAETPSDVVVFLGPETRYGDKVPQAALEEPRGAVPQFFNLQFKAYTRAAPSLPDSISRATAKAKGKTIVIRTPADFAKAIEQIEHSSRSGGTESLKPR
jgi:hypothetical protein